MPAPIGNDIEKAAALLIQGKLVAIPTETVYGLAANGLDNLAVSCIFEAKNRPAFDPLILHVESIEQAKNLVKHWSEMADRLAKAFWPGPLTLVLPKASHVPNLVTSGQSTVAIRMPNNAQTLALLRLLPFPLAAPSANPFGYVSPTKAQHVLDQLGNRIHYIVDGGDCNIGIESTILAVNNNDVSVLRLGGLALSEIEAVIGFRAKEILTTHSNPMAPGQLDHHYSPKCLLIPMELEISAANNVNEGLRPMGFMWYSRQSYHQVAKKFEDHRYIGAKHYFLSENANDKEAASRLFDLLRQFDKDGLSLVYFEWATEFGLGRAINDRLNRASAKKNQT